MTQADDVITLHQLPPKPAQMLDVCLDSGINVTNQILSHFLCGRHIYAIITVYQIDCDQGPAKRNFIRMYHGISIAIIKVHS